jgi:hypothetical protein
MKLSRRLARRERSLALRSRSRDSDEDWLTEEQWLETYERFGAQGLFAQEPDFPKALAFYREALNEAKTQADPPFDPPPDFMPNLKDIPRLHVLNWRDRFPKLHEAWDWLGEMLGRSAEGIPPVSEAEFAELAEWFECNRERLYELSQPSYLLELGDGRKTSPANLRYGLWQGPRVSGAGELARDLGACT